MKINEEEFADVLAHVIHEATAPMIGQIAALFRRVQDLESAVGVPQSEGMKRLLARVSALEVRQPRGPDFAGPFDATRTYAKNSMVVRQGALWLSITDKPTGIPGDQSGADGWKLVW